MTTAELITACLDKQDASGRPDIGVLLTIPYKPSHDRARSARLAGSRGPLGEIVNVTEDDEGLKTVAYFPANRILGFLSSIEACG